MEIVKKTADYEIVKKRSGRFGVRGADRKWVNGDEKVKILLAEKLIKAAPPKEAVAAPAEAPAEEAPAEEAPAEEAPAEEAPAEEGAEPSDEPAKDSDEEAPAKSED
jgi:hypothetical protein